GRLVGVERLRPRIVAALVLRLPNREMIRLGVADGVHHAPLEAQGTDVAPRGHVPHHAADNRTVRSATVEGAEQDLRGEAGADNRGPEILADELRVGRWRPPAGRVVPGVARLVLRGD